MITFFPVFATFQPHGFTKHPIELAHRIGQKERVFVTRFVTQGTIEGRIAEILEKKRQLFEEMIGQNGPPRSMGLTEEEVFGLFNVQARPRRTAPLTA